MNNRWTMYVGQTGSIINIDGTTKIISESYQTIEVMPVSDHVETMQKVRLEISRARSHISDMHQLQPYATDRKIDALEILDNILSMENK